jgi:hypothetical protein
MGLPAKISVASRTQSVVGIVRTAVTALATCATVVCTGLAGVAFGRAKAITIMSSIMAWEASRWRPFCNHDPETDYDAYFDDT